MVLAPSVEESQRSDLANVGMLVGISAAVAWGVSYTFDSARAGDPHALIGIVATYAVLGAFAVFYAVRKQEVRRWLVPGWGDVTRGFACAVVLFVCAFGVVKVMTMHGSPRAAWMARLYLQLGDTKPLRQHQAWVGLGIASMAALEEIVWRGWAKSVLEELVGVRFGWIAVGVLYALAHLPTLWALSDTMVGLNPIVVIGALGAGLVWSAMAHYFNRLWPSIVCHALFDWAVLMMFRLWGPSV